MFILPDIRAFGGEPVIELPCMAYLGGTSTRDAVRLIGFIGRDGIVGDITVHGGFGCYDVDVDSNRLFR